jgi:hypothetical protein
MTLRLQNLRPHAQLTGLLGSDGASILFGYKENQA